MHGYHRYSGLGKHLRSSLILVCRLLPHSVGFGRAVDIRGLYGTKSAIHGGFAEQSLTRARRVLKTPRTPVIALCIMQTAVAWLAILILCNNGRKGNSGCLLQAAGREARKYRGKTARDGSFREFLPGWQNTTGPCP